MIHCCQSIPRQADDEAGMAVLKETADAVSAYYEKHGQAATEAMEGMGRCAHLQSDARLLEVFKFTFLNKFLEITTYMLACSSVCSSLDERKFPQ